MDTESKVTFYLTLIAIPIVLALFALFVIFPSSLLVFIGVIIFGLISFLIYMIIFNIVDNLDIDTLESVAKFLRIKDKEDK